MNCRFLCPWDSPGKNTGVGYHALLQGLFLTQGLNPSLSPALQVVLYHYCQLGSQPGDFTCGKFLRSGIFSVLGKDFVPESQFKVSVYTRLGMEI